MQDAMLSDIAPARRIVEINTGHSVSGTFLMKLAWNKRFFALLILFASSICLISRWARIYSVGSFLFWLIAVDTCCQFLPHGFGGPNQALKLQTVRDSLQTPHFFLPLRHMSRSLQICRLSVVYFRNIRYNRLRGSGSCHHRRPNHRHRRSSNRAVIFSAYYCSTLRFLESQCTAS